MKADRRRYQRIRAILLFAALAIFLLPLFWSVLASFGITPDDTQSPPVWTLPPTWTNYAEIGITSPEFVRALIGSIGVSGMAMLLTIVVSFLAAYSLAHADSNRSGTLVQAFLILASLPVMAYVLPLYDTLRRLGLYDTFLGVVLADTAVFAPLAVYIQYGYLKRMPTDLEESARLEGASALQMIWNIAVPVTASGAAATAIIVFVLNWNMLLVPLVLAANHVITIPLLMSDFFILEREIEWPAAAAVLITSLVPLVALIVIAHRILERFALTSPQEVGEYG